MVRYAGEANVQEVSAARKAAKEAERAKSPSSRSESPASKLKIRKVGGSESGSVSEALDELDTIGYLEEPEAWLLYNNL